ncbi:outer membrane lipoprotein-sorting protein [Pseudomonas sp. Irchel s3a18]|uniref:outer membrane lipoprotein-sorting protein n=1 Tax=Pseudomonas sp. Irchel s3a18 TaxID=2009053 RepID=UPI000BA4928F|nr:outer membrane lipoprotein-sorting protein [Pseudomonas sp. Irchel s3a18]
MFRVLLLFFALLPALVHADPEADLREMSLYRGYADEPFIFDMHVATFRGGKQSGPTQQSSVLFRNFSAVLVDFTAPAAYAGRRILFSGQQMWLSLPNTSRMVRISAADRLMGEASNGDILNIDLDLYTIEELKIEVVDGVDYKRVSAVAKQPGVLYPRVDFLLEQQSNRPFRSYHFASSGKVLKVAQYVKFDVDGGRERLRQLILLDPGNSANYTVMEFSHYRTADLPAVIFAPAAIRNPLNY